MSKLFKDMATALAFRDVMERVATGVVNRLRPASFVGEVTTVNILTRTATVRRAGQEEDEPDTRVNYLPHLAPNQILVQDVQRGNIVEVSGTSGDLYITKIYSGLYTDEIATPAGMRADFDLPAPPIGWALENGQALSRTVAFRLFAAIGTTHGVGNGTTTFNVDNTMGRSSVGWDPLQTEFDNLTDKGGTKTKSLSSDEGPVHAHDFEGQTFSWGANNGNVYANVDAVGGASPSGTNRLFTFQNVGGWTTTYNAGSGNAFSLLSPYYVSLKCIKL